MTSTIRMQVFKHCQAIDIMETLIISPALAANTKFFYLYVISIVKPYEQILYQSIVSRYFVSSDLLLIYGFKYIINIRIRNFIEQIT